MTNLELLFISSYGFVSSTCEQDTAPPIVVDFFSGARNKNARCTLDLILVFLLKTKPRQKKNGSTVQAGGESKVNAHVHAIGGCIYSVLIIIGTK